MDGQFRRIYPVTPQACEELNIHKGAIINVNIDVAKSIMNPDRRVESRKIRWCKSHNVGSMNHEYLIRMIRKQQITCAIYKEYRPFKQEDPSFYVVQATAVRQMKNGKWRFRCKGHCDTKSGHTMEIRDMENKIIEASDFIILGRHSMEYLKNPFIVSVIKDKRLINRC